MTQPIQLPDPGSDDVLPARQPVLPLAAIAAALALAVGTALLGAVAGWVWGAVSPRATLQITSPGVGSLIHAETSAYIAADGLFVLIALIGGAVSGLVGHRLAVGRHGPVAMAGLLAGAVGAAYLARWVGEQSGLATFQHLLATLPTGARMHDSLTLGAGSALAFWPFAAGLVAGGLELLAHRSRHQGVRLAAPDPVGSLPPAPGRETSVRDVDSAASGGGASID